MLHNAVYKQLGARPHRMLALLLVAEAGAGSQKAAAAAAAGPEPEPAAVEDEAAAAAAGQCQDPGFYWITTLPSGERTATSCCDQTNVDVVSATVCVMTDPVSSQVNHS